MSYLKKYQAKFESFKTTAKHLLQKYLQIYKELINESKDGVDQLKYHILKVLPYWIAGVLTAITANFYAKIFHYCEELALNIYHQANNWVFIITPIGFLLSFLLVDRYAPYASGSGIPQLMVAADLSRDDLNEKMINKLLSVKVFLVKILSSLIGVMSGGAIGREGPTLQLSGVIFFKISSLFGNDIKTANKQGFILAGGAAGLAAAFNTPMGGIAYAIEELSRTHLTNFRTGVLHSVIVAGLITQTIMGSYLVFGYPKTNDFELKYIGLVVGLAAFAALVVTMFTQLLKRVVVFRRQKLKKFSHKCFFALGSGLVFALIVKLTSETSIGSGNELINLVLFEQKKVEFWDLLARFGGSTITYANGGAGGIFAPTLTLGGVTASLLNELINTRIGVLSCLIGMTAGLSALTHSPLTSFIIILEMTDRHSVIFPLMIASVVGHGVSKFLAKDSFYGFVYESILGSLALPGSPPQKQSQTERH